MSSQPGKQTIVIIILPNISISKGIQAIKFGQLIKYNLKNIFLVVEKLFPDPFLKNQNWAYFWINSLKFYPVYFYCMPRWGLSKYIETKRQTTCFYLIQKRGLELVSLLDFLHNFWRKIFLLLPNSAVWLPIRREILGNVY